MDPLKNDSFENSKIERLKRALYSRNDKLVPKEERSEIEEKATSVPTSWNTEKSFAYTPDTMSKKSSNSFFNKFLLGSLGFFILCLAAALFIFFGGVNMISSNNLDVKIVAPSSVSSGEELPIGLSIINGNREDLESVNLFIDYPEGSQAIDSDKILTHDKISLGRIANGASIEYSIRNLIFGEKDSIKTYVFRIEYKVKGSNATFSKEKTYDVSIGSSPVLFEINYPKEINSGQDVKLSINITSNSTVTLKNTLVKVEYPYGFTYKSSNIKPLRDNSIWNMGDLKNGDKKTLEVLGTMIGQNEEDKTFRVSSGVQTVGSSDFDTDLAEENITIGIRKSFFDLSLVTNSGNVKEVGQFVPVFVKWQNTLPDKILNAKISAKLSGNIVDRNHVSVGDGGFYQSIDNTVVWDKNNDNKLSQILPGEDGQVSVSLVSITDPVAIRAVKNPHMDIHVIMAGDRAGDTTAKISSEGDIVIKIMSTLTLTAKTFRVYGSMVNTGPIPPKAEKESTYTINWVLTNTTNDLSGAIVRTKLPSGVTWKGEFTPQSEKISYDPDTKTVTWNVGSVAAGVGFTYSPREVSFKVGIVPSVSQISFSAPLTGEVNASATDTYTNSTLTSTSQPHTTEFSDPNFKPGDGVVGK